MSEHSSHTIYTPGVLAIYDAWVLSFSNRWLWKCPTPKLLAHYNEHVSANHLDVGVGSGYYLDRCHFPQRQPQVALLDINPHALRAASRRIRRYRPREFTGDIRQPLDLGGAKFDSIAINYVLHCLPGDMTEKGAVVNHLAQHLTAGGVLFGATILGREAPQSNFARRLMARYQARKIFGNAADDVAGLKRVLNDNFGHVSVKVVGCVALFAGRRTEK